MEEFNETIGAEKGITRGPTFNGSSRSSIPAWWARSRQAAPLM